MTDTVADGARYTLPANPFTAPEGMVFDRWNRGNPGTRITVTGDTTIVAVWKDAPVTTWTVTLSDGYGTTQTYTINDGEIFTLPECPFTAPEGKEFDTWNYGNPGTTITVSSNVTVTAVWKDIPAKKWTITLTDGNGHNQTFTVDDGESITLPECTFTAPEGKQFSTWSMGEKGTVIVVTSDLTITAIWEDLTWTVRLSDGQGNNVVYSVENNATFNLPECPFDTPEGLSFVRWNIGAPGTSIIVTSDVIITAVWEIAPSTEWTVILNSGTGLSKSFTVENGEIFIIPACPFIAPADKEFDRWSAGSVGDQITVTSDITITAIWKDAAGERYYPVEGADQTYVIGSDTELGFSVKRVDHDEMTFDLFIGIELDGVLVSPNDYDAEPGSVIVTLNKRYLDTLKGGEHVMTINFVDGSSDVRFFVDRDSSNHLNVILIAGILLLVVDGFATTVYVIRRRKDRND